MLEISGEIPKSTIMRFANKGYPPYQRFRRFRRRWYPFDEREAVRILSVHTSEPCLAKQDGLTIRFTHSQTPSDDPMT